MAEGKHEEKVHMSIEQVWEFVKDMNNWAPLVPGYIDHDIISDNQSIWKFNGDIGVVKKEIHLKIHIKRWQKPVKVIFDLTGVNEKFTGDGYFEAEVINGKETKIIGSLMIQSKGMLAPLVNPVLQSFVPKTAKELTEAIAKRLTEIKKERLK